MRKLIFASLFLGSVSAVSAQGNINKGNWMLGGDASITSQKQGDYKTTDFSLSPNVGYFFMNNFAGGLRAAVTSSKTSFGSEDAKTSGLALAPFVRYYFLPASEKINLFADGSLGFGQGKYENVLGDQTNNFSYFGIKAGPAIFITPSTALEIAVGYNSTKYEDEDDRENTFGLSIGFQIHIPGTTRK